MSTLPLLFPTLLIAQAATTDAEAADLPSAEATAPAEEAVAEPEGAPEQAPIHEPSEMPFERARLRVVVPPLDAHGVALALAENLSGVVLLRLQEVPNTEVVGHRDIAQFLSQDQQKQLAGCGDDAQCASNIAGAIDASRLVWGSVGKVGDRFLVNLALLDIQNNAVLRRTRREALSADNLVEATSEATDALWLTPDLPAERCVDCDVRPTSASISLKLGNNFMNYFQSGVEVNKLAPAFDLDLGYKFGASIAAFVSIGLSYGQGTVDNDGSTPKDYDMKFFFVPLTLGARYHSSKIVADLSWFGGLAFSVDFVRTVIANDPVRGARFSAHALGGLAYAVFGNVGLLLELSYRLTTDTPSNFLRRPLGAAAIKLGVSYGF
ncbi:MAG: hypothetical protein V3T05_03965 [Myxococcota bacterium]